MQELIVNMIATMCFFTISILMAITLFRCLNKYFPIVYDSPMLYFLVMLVAFTITSLLDIWLPYGNTDYTLNVLIHDMLMASIITLFNECLRKRLF